MDPYQSTQHAIADGNSSSDANNKRRHNTLKERIKRSMNKAGESTVRRRSSLLAAASALASLAGGGDSKVTDADTNTEVVDTPGQSTGKANNDLHEERWRATTTAEEVPITFPQKLMSVLDNDELQDIITWLPHGRAFIILQKKKFASDVMPVYFKHSKFTSFTRKLNRWGFTRVPRGPETGSYYHKYFQRGNHHLCMQMHCQSKPNTSNSSPRTSPPPPAAEPQKVSAKAKVPVSPGSKVAAAMSTLRMEASPLENRDQDGHRPQVDFKTTLSRQQELLRMDQEQEDQRRKKLMEEQQQHDQKALAALYHSSRRTRDSPERKVKEQVELPSNLPAMPFLPSSGRMQNRSFLSSSLSSSTGQHQHQSLPSSFTASGTSPHASLHNSWNTEPNTRTSMALSPRAERKRLHHLQDIDWSKISNYSMQEERRELPDQSRPYLPAPQETAMASRRQMMAPAPAYETMLNDYKRSTAALDTTSTAQHRHVIQSAMDALKASNDRGYLAMLMQREREKAQGRVASDEHVSQIGFQNDGHVHAAMQMRQLEEHYQQGSPALSEYLPLPTDLAESPGRVEQLQQRMKLLSSASYIKANPQVHVAPPNPPKSKYPFGSVRRASAA